MASGCQCSALCDEGGIDGQRDLTLVPFDKDDCGETLSLVNASPRSERSAVW